MKYSIKYIATFLTVLLLASACEVANTEEGIPELTSKVVFQSNHEGQVDLFSANPDGSGMEKITANDLIESSPSLSFDGTKVAYSIMGEIFVMNTDGTGKNKITGQDCNDENRCIEPVWSPSGDKITYVQSGDIFIMNADGSESSNVTNTRNVSEYGPAWSPDGSKIAFTHKSEGDSEIYLLDLATAEQTPLTNNEVEDEYADWSPDGTELILVGTDNSKRVRLYIYNFREASRRALNGVEPGKVDSEAKPCWGGDDFIYFTSVEEREDGANPKMATSHNASRSNRSQGGISDIVTDGNVTGISCTKEIDKASPL